MKQKSEEYRIINEIKCKIVYEKIKNTYIQIKDGEVIIKTSPRSSIKYIEGIVNGKTDWINKKLEEQSTKQSITYKNGSTVRVLGKPYTLKIMYVDSKRNALNMDNQYLYCDLSRDCKVNEQENVKKLIDKLYKYIAKEEGIIAAIESSHAVAHLLKIAPKMKKDQIIICTLSGRGDKDVAAIARYRGIDLHE